MNLTKLSLSNPVAVAVGIVFVLLFGVLSLLQLPIQMIPNVERPSLQINTTWRAAAPQEIETEILEPQEDALRGLNGLKNMESSASNGRGRISLSFDQDLDINRALLEVMNRLTRVSDYPIDAQEPSIFSGAGERGSPIAWFALRTKSGTDLDTSQYQDFLEDVVLNRIERVIGISNTNNFGGRAKEVRISFDPLKVAATGLSISTLLSQSSGNTDSSGGFTNIGRRQYTLRFTGSYQLDEFSNMVLGYNNNSPIRLSDVASLKVVPVDKAGAIYQNGLAAIAFNAESEVNVNVLNVMDDLKLVIQELNEGPVARAGLEIIQVSDETIYIKDSIRMLRNNLLLGIFLAIGILWLFLRRVKATLLVALAIPISLFFAFFGLNFAGRTLNIISFAGLAFAMGMVLDSAIVVLENIVRLREKGASPQEAAYQGATQVWGALLASTVTTVAIFLPILFLKDIAAQLFADLALAISIAVVIALIISVTVIPTASTTFLKNLKLKDPHSNWWDNITSSIMRITNTAKARGLWITSLLIIGVSLTVILIPKADYLPTGKQNFIRGFINAPTGQSIDITQSEFIDKVNERARPYVTGDKQPKIKNYYLGMFGSNGFMGIRADNRNEVDQLIQELRTNVLTDFPDTRIFVNRASIFGRLAGGSGIEMNIQSRDLDAMLSAAKIGISKVQSAMPGVQARPIPGVELATPELRLIPIERNITEAGLTRQGLANIIRALGDGVYVGDYFDGDKRRNIILRGTEWDRPEDLLATPIQTPLRGTQALSSLVELKETVGPGQIRRVDRNRTITLNIRPPENLSLQETISILQEKVEPAIRAALPEDGEVSYYGSADSLKVALANMGKSFALAMFILYLLMSALFRSFKDSLLVLIALPVATVGSVIALKLVDIVTPQSMDLLTMIGFITLLGLVVNNAILLVHQTRIGEREGLTRKDSVEQAIRLRLRPIFMSTATSLFGMLPLLLIPGPGSELYRGLAAVIIGGLAVSTIFTLILLPCLLRIGENRHTSIHIQQPQVT